jgi:lipase/uncharacterized protein/lipase (class 2)
MRIAIGTTGPATTLGRTALHLLFAVLASCAVLWAAVAPASAKAKKMPMNPILIVHGFESSGANFESQTMRFESNGYPHSWVATIDYNSTAAVGNPTEVHEQIDKAIAELKQRTGRSQVDLVGHSEGTSVDYSYLTEGEKAAERDKNVAAYINMDGQEKLPPVPTLALWAEKSMGTIAAHREIKGATNVTIPNETHVQQSTSATSFIQMYKFLRGKAPKHDILAQRKKEGPIEVAGKAVDFPANTGLAGSTVRIWPVDAGGFRYVTGPKSFPVATISITTGGQGEGEWGPVDVEKGQRYEFEVEQASQPTLHIYYPPFPRSDYQLRLQAQPALEASGKHAGSVGVVSVRYKEMWGDAGGLPGSSEQERDELKFNGLNICVPVICPLTKVVNAIFVGEGAKHPKETNLSEPNPTYSSIPFITGAEVYIPATSKSVTSDVPTETVKVQLNSRGEGPTGSAEAKAKTLEEMSVPNWDSSTNQIELEWHDFQKLTF